jgi:hypothetical protein
MSIRSATVRAAVLGATALFTTTGAAQAEVTRLADGALIDATSDGRYVLYEAAPGPRLLDRTAGTTIPVPAGAEALADRSPRVLLRDGTGYRVYDAATGTIVLATLNENTDPVPASKAVLVRDGQSVIFETTAGGSTRTLERDLSTATTTERLSGVQFLDASEDGHVVTYQRALPPTFRPAGQQALKGDPAGGIPGTAVGYRVDQGTPRIVNRTSWSQTTLDLGAAQCNARNYVWNTSEPFDLDVIQNGATGTYGFKLRTHQTSVYSTPGDTDLTTWLYGNPSAFPSFVDRTAESTISITQDPVSAAYGFSVEFSEDGVLGRGHGHLIGGDGQSRDLPNIGEIEATGADVGRTVLPVRSGADAVFDALPVGGTRGVYLAESGQPSGPNPNGWRTLPSSADSVDTAALRADARYANCQYAGAITDYVKVSPAAGTSRVQKVTYTPYLTEQISASLLTARITWFGVTVWSRTFNRPGTFSTPALPRGVAGFKLGLSVRLTDGPPIATSLPLEPVR